MEGKPCSKCGVVKPLEEFDRNRGAKDGRHWECKACRRRASMLANNREGWRGPSARLPGTVRRSLGI